MPRPPDNIPPFPQYLMTDEPAPDPECTLWFYWTKLDGDRIGYAWHAIRNSLPAEEAQCERHRFIGRQQNTYATWTVWPPSSPQLDEPVGLAVRDSRITDAVWVDPSVQYYPPNVAQIYWPTINVSHTRPF